MRRKHQAFSQKSNILITIIAIAFLSVFIFGFGAILPASAQTTGASLYFAPGTGTYGINSGFSLAIKLNSGPEIINAAEGGITFDQKLIEVSSISKTGSILSLWTTEPAFNNKTGTIIFGGGTPRNGFKGTDGQVLIINFKAKAAGKPVIRFSAGAVLANDGKGTNILTGMGSAGLTISPEEIPPASEAGATDTQNLSTDEYNKPNVSSETHPDQNSWYNLKDISLKWDLPAGTNNISFDLNKEALADVDTKPETQSAEKKYENVDDGVWYFHIKFKDGKRWGTTMHYRIMIDALPPSALEVEVRKVQIGDWPEIEFKSKDEGSGLKKYNIIIGSLESQAHDIPPEETIFKPSNLTPGEHTAMIIAVDNAGNETIKTINFTVDPIETPVIKNYSQEIKPNDKFFISGTSLPNVVVNLAFANEANTVINGATKADANGNWFYVNENGLPNGQFTAWAEAMNEKGLKSNPTSKIAFLVSPPVFTRLGSYVINYFTVFSSLLFMTILIIISIVYLVRIMRKRLRKETVEVEYVLHRNFVDLGEIVDEEFTELNKLAGTAAYNKERVKFKQRIKAYITEAEKKIMKEIKDVEDILK